MHEITLTVRASLSDPDAALISQRLRAAVESFELGDYELDSFELTGSGDAAVFQQLDPDLDVWSRVTVRPLPEGGPVNGIRITAGKVIEPTELTGLASGQRLVAGLIQRIELDDGSSLYVNEEGKLHNLPPNSIATDLALASGAIFPRDMIRGDAYLVGPGDGQGGDCDVNDRQRRRLELIHSEAL